VKKVIVFKHVSGEVLGTLNPLLKEQKLSIRYVNFDRYPSAEPVLDRYHGLVVFGGWMGVYEADRYAHLKVEMRLIEQALKRDIPVLGICLGSQILAHVLGAKVRKHEEKEVGWSEVTLTEAGKRDPLLSHFSPTEKLFQMHGDTFDIPANCVHLAESRSCASQAFRYGDKAYGLQFHLEIDRAMIERFLKVPKNREEVEAFAGKHAIERMEAETDQHLPRSVELSRQTFLQFVRLFGVEAKLQRTGHGKDKLK
jgi:GMP synthase (glutamine-hydrolysing)